MSTMHTPSGTARVTGAAAPPSEPAATPRPEQRPGGTSPSRSGYGLLLTWAFSFFSSVRLLAYLPTMMLIVQQGDSSQHSLLTWSTWAGANLTMAAWLHEHNARRFTAAAWVSLGNAAMCGLTVALILAFRP